MTICLGLAGQLQIGQALETEPRGVGIVRSLVVLSPGMENPRFVCSGTAAYPIDQVLQVCLEFDDSVLGPCLLPPDGAVATLPGWGTCAPQNEYLKDGNSWKKI